MSSGCAMRTRTRSMSASFGIPTTVAARYAPRAMLPVTMDTVRVFLHVLAATVIAWPAFAVVVATGIWNVVAVKPDWSSSYGTTLIVKLVLVAASGLTAFLHSRARSRRWLALFGAASGLTAVGALFLGIVLG